MTGITFKAEVSIHAPVRERLKNDYELRRREDVSIHAPVRERPYSTYLFIIPAFANQIPRTQLITANTIQVLYLIQYNTVLYKKQSV